MFALDTVPGVDTTTDRERVGSRRPLRPEDVGPLVESVVRGAMNRLDAEAAAAHAESSSVVSAAVQRSAHLILSFDAGRATAPQRHEQLAPAAPVDLLPPEPVEDPLGPEVSLHNAAQVYDLFWADIPSDQPIRERLRRWAQRPAQ